MVRLMDRKPSRSLRARSIFEKYGGCSLARRSRSSLDKILVRQRPGGLYDWRIPGNQLVCDLIAIVEHAKFALPVGPEGAQLAASAYFCPKLVKSRLSQGAEEADWVVRSVQHL